MVVPRIVSMKISKYPNPLCFYELTSFHCISADPHSSVDSVADLRTGGRRFDPRLGQYSFRGLMIVIATGFIPLSPLSVVSNNGYLGKQPVAWKEYCAEYSGKHGQVLWTPRYKLNTVENSVKHHTINPLYIGNKTRSRRHR